MSVLSRCRLVLLPAVLAAAFAVWVSGQSKPGTPVNTPPSAPTPTLNPGINPGAPSPLDTSREMFFISGRVAFDDGTSPNTNISIERVCEMNSHTEAHTDSKGRFSFKIGDSRNIVQDASVANDDEGSRAGLARAASTASSPGMNSPLANTTPAQSGAAVTERTLNRCELRAVYPGYRSDSFSLANRRPLDNPDIGTLILHRLGDVKGTTISLSSAMAPKPALKAYEKAMQQARKGDLDAAETGFARAVDIYPQYASAWFELGKIRQAQNRFAEAGEAYLRASKADPKYASPYDRLAQISGFEGKWDDAIKYSGEAIALDPVELPSSWYFNALGYWSLRQYEQAGKSAQETIKLDSGHRFPMAELILATACAGRADYTSEMQHLRSYLTFVSEGKNADMVRQRITELEQQFASAKK
jgi:tetratricopeptide (TPR) repeat protein